MRTVLRIARLSIGESLRMKMEPHVEHGAHGGELALPLSDEALKDRRVRNSSGTCPELAKNLPNLQTIHGLLAVTWVQKTLPVSLLGVLPFLA